MEVTKSFTWPKPFPLGLESQEVAHRHGVGTPKADGTTRTLMKTPRGTRPRCERGIRFQTFLLGLKKAGCEKKLETRRRIFKWTILRTYLIKDNPIQSHRAAHARRADVGQTLC